MEKLFRRLGNCLKEGSDAVLLTVVESSGSTPRGAGSRMVVVAGEPPTGTIGGGKLEYIAERRAHEALREKRSFIESFSLSNNDAAGLGMVCGGEIEVLFQYFSRGDDEALSVINDILDAYNCNGNSVLTTEFSEDGWNMYMGAPSSQSGKRYYSERLVSEFRAVIFGGGHLARSLSPVLSHIGFRHIVIDDRPEFCRKEIFPGAEDVITADLSGFSAKFVITPSDFVLIMTRGHLLDYEVLAQALKSDACYIGMIGSRAKIAETYRRLYEHGFTEEDTRRVYAPIGVSISAETPEEISVSIAAELIKVKHGLRKYL